MNEILLVLSLLVIYGSVLLVYRLFGKSGLYCFTAIATITANIEVLIMVDAFGMEQTLGNILFADSRSYFLPDRYCTYVYGSRRTGKGSTESSKYRNFYVGIFYRSFPVLAFIQTECERLGTAGDQRDFFQYTKTDDRQCAGLCNLSAV